MAWLGGWLKELVLIVLLATFVDMILPSRSMERYVKLVLSLLILLTLLSPVVHLLSSNPADLLKHAFQAQQQADTGKGEMTLEQILARGSKLRQQQEKKSVEWAGQEVAREMKAQIEEATGLGVQSVQVTLAEVQQARSDLKAGTEIGAVTVKLANGSVQTDDTDSDRKRAPITPITIEPVPEEAVQVEVQTSPGKSSSLPNEPEAKPAATFSTNKITGLLHDKWGIDASKVKVIDSEQHRTKL